MASIQLVFTLKGANTAETLGFFWIHLLFSWIQRDGNSQHPPLWNEDSFSGCLGHVLWAPFIRGTNSDGRHSSHSCSLPVNTSWCSKWHLIPAPTFSNSSLTHLMISSVHCLSGPRLSCAALYANPHNKELGDTCQPHVHPVTLSSFFSACFLTTVSQQASRFM